MIIVSGCPRSGTSLTMDILQKAVGDDNIYGSKFPQEDSCELLPKQEKETQAHFEIREYMHAKYMKDNPASAKDFKDMNPNGFWECLWSVQGISYTYGTKTLLDEVLSDGKNKICKIVSQGLLPSDVRFIDKVIYLIRHPRNVAKSQERLSRSIPGVKDSLAEFAKMVIHTPEMYITTTLQACRWFVENPDVPVMFLNFTDLQTNPDVNIDRMAKFVGYGDFENARGTVEPRLNRSKIESIEHALWEDADLVYEMFNEQRYQEILDLFANDPEREYNKETTRWSCLRRNAVVNYHTCQMCKSNETVRRNFIQTARVHKIRYKNEPCLFDCGMNPHDKNPQKISDNIKNNDWVG